MVQFIKKVTSDIYIVSFELFKIMIPTLILVKIAEIYGLVAVLTNLFAPIMTMMGLPAEMALAITTTMLTNPYAGIIVLASTPGIEDLTVAQTTILASFILFTHSVIIEAAISRQAGLSAGATIIIRILSGILFCTLLNSVFSSLDLFNQTAVLNLPEMSSTPTLQQWVIDQIKGLIFIQFVIIILITFLEILRLIGIEKIIRICLSPLFKSTQYRAECINHCGCWIDFRPRFWRRTDDQRCKARTSSSTFSSRRTYFYKFVSLTY